MNTIFGFKSEKAQVISKLTELQAAATNFQEWKDVSEQLDSVLGNNKWKMEDESEVYDYELVKSRKLELEQCRESGDMKRLLFMVRTQLERNLGNMGDVRLYKSSQTGTKTIIEDYISECELCLQELLKHGESDSLTEVQILDTLIQTRKSFGRTALVLSGGSMLGLLHIGVMRELMHANLLPRIISGSSAGSIFASILCIHFDNEIDELFNTLIEENFNIFEETGNEESFFVRLARFLKHGTILDNKYLATTMQSLLGSFTFQEAYNRTRKILNVTVSPASIYESARILNHLTAPNVLIWSAVCASCSVPFVFPSYTLLAKDSTTGEIYSWSPSPMKFIDGSVDNDLPLSRLSELFNVNHFIACQVNPHVVPFMRATSAVTSMVEDFGSGIGSWRHFLTEGQNMFTEELSHYLYVSHELGIFKNLSSKLRSVISQKYTGDITIVPGVQLIELKDLFKNPTKDMFLKSHLRGQRATWPNLALIRNHCAIELALDKSIHQLRSRMIPLNKSSSIISRNSIQNELGRKLHYSTANLRIAYGQSGPQVYKSSNTIEVRNHTRRKSEGISYTSLLHKRKSYDGPAHRVIRSPTISRKNSQKSIKCDL